ncbi:MAG: ATP-dependent Clp protease adaptor ClpS [Saprospiraceae bacterium]
MSEKSLTNKELEELLVAEIDNTIGKKSEIIVFNDDFNTFDWVIQSLMEVCKHSFDQSEQLSILIHFKGKATVKTGPFGELKPMKDLLVERGLSAVIESFQEK